MTTAASHKLRLDAIMISRCQGDDTFVAFQPMGIIRFWRNGEIHFFPKMSTLSTLASTSLAIKSARSTIA